MINQGTESDKADRITDDKGPSEDPRRALTTVATSYADSLRAPAKLNSTIPVTGVLRITQMNRGKLLENPKIPGLRVNNKPKKGQTRDTERFLGYTEFRNKGKESVVNDTPKLTISVSGDGKRKVIWGNKGGKFGEGDKKVLEWIPRGQNNVGRVSKPNNKPIELVQVQPKHSFMGPSTYEEGESSNNPKPMVWKKKDLQPNCGGPTRVVQEKVKSLENTKDQAQNAVVSMGERKYLETFSRRSRLISVDSTTVMVQSEHERETTHTFRLQFALGINISLLRGAQERFGAFGTVANGMSWAHRYGEAHHTVVDEVEGAEWSKDQGSLVVYSRESAMVTDTEAETEEIIDIPPINSYGGQKV